MELENINILLIEDEKIVATMLIELLSSVGGFTHTIDHAENLADGLKMIDENRYHVVLLDLNLPDSLGIATVRKVHKKSPDIAIVVFTGQEDEQTAFMALQEGAQDFVIKGHYSSELLLKSIRYSLERKLFQDELKATHAQMVHSEKMASIGQLAAGVAHEINNPIGFVSSNLATLDKYVDRLLGFLETQSNLLLECGDDAFLKHISEERKKLKIDLILDDLKNLIHESQEGTERVKKIVQDLKSFSRAEQQEADLADINEILNSSINIVWNELKYKSTINKDLEEVPLTKCFPQQLGQVFVNLLVNAGQAIEKQGEISIRTWKENSHILISISDTGCGISKRDSVKIFDPFFTTKEIGKGTGLGLSIAYEIIVQKHNGAIWVESELGKGATFFIKLPIIGS